MAKTVYFEAGEYMPMENGDWRTFRIVLDTSAKFQFKLDMYTLHYELTQKQ